MNNPPPSFFQTLRDIDVSIEPQHIEQFSRFLDLLDEANQQFNLTAIRNREDAWERHILDSLTLVPLLETLASSAQSNPEEPVRIADVGSGGGLPAIPLAIMLPRFHFALIESTGKKANFLTNIANAFALNNITVVNDRAEAVGKSRSTCREHFNFVTARAVDKLPTLLEITVPLLKVAGYALLIKGQKAQDELKQSQRAAQTLGAAHVDTVPTPTGQIVIFEKESPTPKPYPRPRGEPKRNPL